VCSVVDYITLSPLNNAVTRTVNGLSFDTEYCFRVRAYTIVGVGPWTDDVMGKTCKSHVIQVIMWSCDTVL